MHKPALEQVEAIQALLQQYHRHPDLTTQCRRNVMIATDLLRNTKPVNEARSEALSDIISEISNDG